MANVRKCFKFAILHRPASETFLMRTEALKCDLQISTRETMFISSSNGQLTPISWSISSVHMNLRSSTTKRVKFGRVLSQKTCGMLLSRSDLRKTVRLGCVNT